MMFPCSEFLKPDKCKWIRQPNKLSEVEKYLKGNKLALDLGANVGVWTVKMAEMFNEVIAIEPIALNYWMLKENTKHLPNVSTIQAAAYRGTGVVRMEIGPALYGKVRKDKGFEVQSVAIDDMNLKPDFIKIDVDGVDIQALEGAKKTIEKYKPVICIEMKENQQAITDFLTAHGYAMKFKEKPDEIWA